MSVYEEALFYKKSIIDEVNELRSSISKYKSAVDELEQVASVMFDEDYHTTGSAEIEGKMRKVFSRLDSCDFGGSGLGTVNVTIEKRSVD